MAEGKLHDDLRWDLSQEFLSTTPLSTVDIDLSLDDEEDKESMIIDEWLIARCQLIAKKGHLGLYKNWRGICRLDIASKILDSILIQRLQAVMEDEGMESQTGFRYFRGTARLHDERFTRKRGARCFKLPPFLFADDCAVVLVNCDDICR